MFTFADTVPGTGLVLENEYGQKQLVSSESLADLFKLFNKNVGCVVMNACYSEVQAKAIHEHINCVIGMNYKIGDKAAIQFATGFYNALINAINYQDSFEFGKNLLDLKNITESGIPQIKIKDNSQSLIDSDSTNIKSKQENNMTENNIQGDYIQQDGSFGVGVNKGTINTDKLAGTINEAQSKNLAEAAKEIQELLEQLDKTYDTSTTFGKMQVATETIKTIENNPDLKVRIISALKVGGVKAFEQFLNHPAASFVIGALEDWQKSND
ncbi:MAG: hypothetical protein SWZ49_28815 [Cyanobacteriota bacterium]|nr:hypothetical protein [Cyanobacteriota bacterium]